MDDGVTASGTLHDELTAVCMTNHTFQNSKRPNWAVQKRTEKFQRKNGMRTETFSGIRSVRT